MDYTPVIRSLARGTLLEQMFGINHPAGLGGQLRVVDAAPSGNAAIGS
jgi:hypothetical protein